MVGLEGYSDRDLTRPCKALGIRECHRVGDSKEGYSDSDLTRPCKALGIRVCH